MTQQRQEQWFSNANGRAMNPDNSYGRQCKDVPDDYCIHIFGDWVSTLKPGNANVAFDNSNGDYFVKVRNDPNDPNLVPPRGAILCYGGWSGNSAGHILVIESSDTNGYTGIEQDGFTVRYDAAGRVINQGAAAYRVTRSWSWHAASLIGWLIPRPEKIIGYTAPVVQPVALLPYQRRVATVVNVRSSPDTSTTPIETYQPGDVVNLSGFVNGQNVDGTTVWFKGKFRDVYMTAAAFEDQSTNGLEDLNPKTPAKELATDERTVVDGGLNVRQAPHTGSSVLKTLAPGTTIKIRGYVVGQEIDGNNIWFDITDGLVWSGGTNSKSTAHIPNITPESPTVPTTPTTPIPVPETYTFEKSFDFVTEVIPAAVGNFAKGNFPASPDGIVIHDFGEAFINNLQSVISTFTNDKSQVSAHLVFSQKRVIQFVDITDRAYHAKTGNVNYGFEIDPAFKNDPDQIANVRKAIKELQELNRKTLTLHTHPEYVNTKCGDDVVLSLYEVPPYEVVPSTPVVTPPADPETPAPKPEPAPPVPAPEAAASAGKFVARLVSQFAAVALVVEGLAVPLYGYTGLLLSSQVKGWITIIVTIALIAAVQFGYKVGSGIKWPF